MINVSKVANSQKSILGSEEIIIVKTDDPSFLRELLDKQNQVEMGGITSASIRKRTGPLSEQQVQQDEGIQLFQKPGTDVPPPKQVNNNPWWGDQQIVPALQTIPNHEVINPISTEVGLEIKLNELKGDPNHDNFTIPLNVNAINGDLGINQNHWVGLRIVKDKINDKFKVEYVDPMGYPISDKVQTIVEAALGKEKINYSEPLTGKAIQYTKRINEGKDDLGNDVISLNGNTDDCGPMLTFAMKRLSDNQPLPDKPLGREESRACGREIRQHFSHICRNIQNVKEQAKTIGTDLKMKQEEKKQQVDTTTVKKGNQLQNNNSGMSM